MLKDYEKLIERHNKERLELVEKHKASVVINLVSALAALLVSVYVILFTEASPYPALLLVLYFLFQAFLQNSLKNRVLKYVE